MDGCLERGGSLYGIADRFSVGDSDGCSDDFFAHGDSDELGANVETDDDPSYVESYELGANVETHNEPSYVESDKLGAIVEVHDDPS